MDNLRTLCVACHADVTAKQMRELAAERRRAKMGAPDIRQLMKGPTVVKGKGTKRTRPQYIDDSGTESLVKRPTTAVSKQRHSKLRPAAAETHSDVSNSVADSRPKQQPKPKPDAACEVVDLTMSDGDSDALPN